MGMTVGDGVAVFGAENGVMVGCEGDATEQACKIIANRTGNQIILDTCFIADTSPVLKDYRSSQYGQILNCFKL
jgi:hypothetical protein